jgi:hypothetical protein
VDSFPTKAAAKEHYRRLLHDSPLGPVPPAYTAELLALLERHPHAAEKIGTGVVGFAIQTAPPFGTRHFLALRADGTSVDFSYARCIDAPPRPLAYLLRVLRAEVNADIARAKRRYFDTHADADGRVLCAESSARITSTQAVADHALPASFHMLAVDWLTALRIQPESVAYITGSNGTQTFLEDRTLAQRWIEFHRDRAHLRIVTTTANSESAPQAKPRSKDRQLLLDAST